MFALILFLAFVLLKTGAFNDLVKTNMETAINNLIGAGTVTIDQVNVSDFGTMNVNGFNYTDADGIASRIESVELDYDMSLLTSNHFVVARALIKDGNIHLVQRKDGTWNVLDLLAQKDKNVSSDKWDIELSNIEFDRVNLQLDPQEIGGIRHNYSGIVKGKIQSLIIPAEGNLSIELDLATRLNSPTAPELDLRADGRYDKDGLTLEQLELKSESSFASAKGLIKYDSLSAWVTESDLSLVFAPLTVKDLAPFNINLRGGDEYTGQLEIKGQGGEHRATGRLKSQFGADLDLDLRARKDNESIIDIDFSVSKFDLSGLTGEIAHKSSISASSSSTLRGEDLTSLSGRLPVRLSNLKWSSYPELKGEIVTVLSGRNFGISGNQELRLKDNPRSRVSGYIDFNFDSQRLKAREVELVEIDYKDFTATREDKNVLDNLNAVLDADLKVSSLEDIDGRAELRLNKSTVHGQSLDGGQLDLIFESGSVHASGDVESPLGQFAISQLRLFSISDQAQLSATIDFSNLKPFLLNSNLSVPIDSVTSEAVLNGRLLLSSASFQENGFTASFNTTLFNSRYQDFEIDRGRFRGQILDDQQVSFHSEIEGQQQFLIVDGQGSLIESGIALSNLRGSTRGIDAQKLMPGHPFSTNLNSTFSGNIKLQDGLPSGEINVVLGQSRVNKEDVKGGRATLWLDQGDMKTESDFEIGRGSFFLATSGNLASAPYSGEILGRWTQFDLAKAMGIDTLSSEINGAVNLSYQGDNFRDLRAEGALVIGRSTLQAIRIDTLVSDFEIQRGEIKIDTLLIRSNVMTASGGGEVYLEDFGLMRRSDFSLEARLRSLQPLAEFLGVQRLSGEGAVSLSLRGREGRTRFDFEPDLKYLSVDEANLSELSANITGLLQQDELSFDGLIDFGVASVPTFTARGAGLVVSYSNERALLTGDINIDENREGSFAGVLETGTDPWTMNLESLQLRFDQDNWDLQQTAEIEIKNGFVISDLLLESDDQQIVIDGNIDLSGEQNIVCTVEGLRAGAFTDLLGFAGLDGVVDGWVIVEGDARDPYLEGQLTAKNITSFGRPVGEMDFESTVEDGVMNIDAVVTNAQGNTLTAKGFLPLLLTLAGDRRDISQDPVGLVVKADTFDLNVLEPFLNRLPVEKLSGMMTADVIIGGIDSELDLQGAVIVDKAILGLRDFGVIYNDISGRADLDKKTAKLSEVEIRSGNGSAKVSGTVDFPSLRVPEYDLDVTAQKFKAIWDQTYHLHTDAVLKLTGSQLRPRLSGSVTVSPGDIFLTDELIAEDLEPIELTDRDLQILEERFGFRVSEDDTTNYDFYEALTITNFDLSFDKNVWMRSSSSPVMDMEFNGDVDVTKQPNGEPILVGIVKVNPSRSKIVQFGKRFDIRTGEVTFTGPLEEALLNIDAQYVVPSRRGGDEVSINLKLSGRQDDLKTSLSSEPLRSTVDIISYLATGRPANESVDGAGEAVTDLAVGQLSSLIEGFAGDQLGLDVFEVEFNTTDGTEVTLGKYLSREFYVSFSQALSEDDRESSIAVEYELFKWLQLQLERRDSALKFNLLWEYAF